MRARKAKQLRTISGGSRTLREDDDDDPCAELDRFFNDPTVPRSSCPNVITWWGVSNNLN